MPERVAMMIIGHKMREVFESCNIVNEEDPEEAARRIDERIATRNGDNGRNRDTAPMLSA